MIDVNFKAMGTDVRLIVAEPVRTTVAPEAAVASASEWLVEFERTLSRFDPTSELAVLNEDPRELVPASPLMRTAAQAGIWAAERSGGLVDPTLVPEIERAGYRTSRAGANTHMTYLALALAQAGAPRRPAQPASPARWRAIQVDHGAGAIHRPPGLRIDSGGFGKGLAADALAHRLRHFAYVVVDCGGDVRIATRAPRRIQVEHPLRQEPALTLAIRRGAIATSGIGRRLWRTERGFAHHLIDPATGEPAWTGLVQATALAPTALEAETLAKAALLAGPGAAHEFLPDGGVLIHDDATVEAVGTLAHLEVAA